MPATQSLEPDSIHAVQAKPIDWLWPQRIPIGKLTLLAGDPGLGKSMLSLDIAARLSRATPFPDAPSDPLRASVPASGSSSIIENIDPLKLDSSLVIRPSSLPATTLLLSAEDDPADTIRPRLQAAGADLTRILLTHPDEGQPKAFSPYSLQDPDNIGILEFAVECNHNVRLLIIDPISAYLGNCNTARNDSVRKALAPLAQLAASHDIAILAITHLRKSNTQRAIYRAMDSLAFAAASRSVWFLTADPADRTRRIFSAAKANLAQEAPALAFRIADNRIIWESQSLPMTVDEALAKAPDPNAAMDRKQAVAWLTEILGQAPLPMAEVVDQGRKLGFTYATLRRAKDDLGVLTKRNGFGELGGWLWELPNGSAG